MTKFSRKLKKLSIVSLMGIFLLHFSQNVEATATQNTEKNPISKATPNAKVPDSTKKTVDPLSNKFRYDQASTILKEMKEVFNKQFSYEYEHIDPLEHNGTYRYVIHTYSGTKIKCVAEAGNFDSKISFEAVNYNGKVLGGNKNKFAKNVELEFYKKNPSNVYLDISLKNSDIANKKDSTGKPLVAYYAIWCGQKLQ